MELIKERNEIDEKYKWNLSSLYKNDKTWEEALNKLDEKIEKTAKYQGKLNNAQNILSFFKEEEILSREIENLFTYASLRQSEDTRSPDVQAMYSKIYGKYVYAMSILAFAQPEILNLKKHTLDEIINDSDLKNYKFYLTDLVRSKPHTLNGEQEKLLASFSEILNNPNLTSEALMNADMTFESVTDSKNNMHEVSNANYILLQNSKDRTLRKNSFKSLYKGYKSHLNTLASTYDGAVKLATTTAKIRNYPSSREMAMFADNIPVNVYDNLIKTVHKHLPSMYRYLKLRKKLLKVEKLHYYDLYAPLQEKTSKKYSYQQACDMLLEAVKPLGSNYYKIVNDGINNKWIDVYPNKGKRNGAFSSGTYDSNPYILCNFTGTLDSVSTLAHEMGHSMHSYLTNKTQPHHYSNYSLFVAEVASTVNENLLIEQLLKNETDLNEKLALLNQYLEGFKGTVFRQTMFAEFEKEVHSMVERGESLTTQSLSELYENLVKLYFKDELIIDEEVKYEWSRIPHFYRPFYVYVYATGFSSAVALSEKILKNENDDVKKYLEFLSMGSSSYPLDELKHAGVDLTTSIPIDIALDKFLKVLKEAEKIVEELGL